MTRTCQAPRGEVSDESPLSAPLCCAPATEEREIEGVRFALCPCCALEIDSEAAIAEERTLYSEEERAVIAAQDRAFVARLSEKLGGPRRGEPS